MSESQEISKKEKSNEMSKSRLILLSILLIVSIIVFFWLLNISGSFLISTLFVSFFFLAFFGLFFRKKDTSLTSKLFPSLRPQSNTQIKNKKVGYDPEFFDYSQKALKFKYSKPLLTKCPDCGFLVTSSTNKCPNCKKNLLY